MKRDVPKKQSKHIYTRRDFIMPARLLMLTILFIVSANGIFAQATILQRKTAFPDLESEKEDEFLVHPFNFEIFENEYYVVDAVENCIKVFSADGRFLRKIGTRGQGPGELLDPFYLAISPEKRTIYVSDGGNRRISYFDLTGNYRGSFRVLANIYNMIYFDSTLIVTAVNFEQKTTLAAYDNNHRIHKLFGEMTLSHVNSLPEINQRSFYSNVFLLPVHHKLYIFYQYLAKMHIFNQQLDLLATKTLQHGPMIEAAKTNIKNSIKEARRLNIRYLFYGAAFSNSSFYLYLRLEGKVLQFNLEGAVTAEIPLQSTTGIIDDNPTFLRHVRGNEFLFSDLKNAQVAIYERVPAE